MTAALPLGRPVVDVAALCVCAGSHYFTIPGVDAYDAGRDAWTYGGGLPVVGHPPCRSWSARLRHFVKVDVKREQALGVWCVEAVRTWGGVIEQPASSLLWEECGLHRPGERGSGGFSIEVNQAWWGHPANKPTWLFVAGVRPDRIPPCHVNLAPVGERSLQIGLSRYQRNLTPPGFADWLVGIARMAGGAK